MCERNLCRSTVVLFLAAGVVLMSSMRSANAKTPVEHLKEAEKPQFRKGHTLLPLTRWGWMMSFDVQVELTENWGYALEFGDATADTAAKLSDPQSIYAKLCALTAADPQRYPLSVLAWRACYSEKLQDEVPEETWCHDMEGRLSNGRKTWSPEAPDVTFQRAGAEAAEPLKAIRRKCPIAAVLNGGEYGLNVIGWDGRVWEGDPVVVGAKGRRSWFDYISERKAHQEVIISDAVRAVVPDRKLYIFYHTSGCPHRDRYSGWWRWAWDYQYMRKVSDIPNSSIYYMHFNSGFTGADDMLTQALNAVGRQLTFKDPLSYNWLCAGWEQEKLGEAAFSDLERYMGYLKCYYTAGQIGGVAGYFSYPRPGGFTGDVGQEPPHWLRQMMVLGHAHALFSHLEDFLRNGDLLPGPDKHRFSKDQPAYEFPSGDAEARVVARKHRKRAEWLVTAWAAGGNDREVSVTIPDLGKVTVLARKSGAVYRVTLKDGQPAPQLVDKDGMLPTAGLGEAKP
jgi:hypothetical protein